MRNEKFFDWLVILSSALISCYVGFHNKFPLVYPDTGTYVLSGFTGTIPLDRPIIYGLIIRYLSLGVSPWLVIFTQGLLCSWLLYKTIGMFLTNAKRRAFLLLTVVILILTTGYSYNVSILLPDIFCAIALLCMINIMFNRALGKTQISVLFILLVLSSSAHFSNLPIVALVVLTFILTKAFFAPKMPTTWGRLISVFASTIVAVVFVSIVNFTYSGNWKVNSASHVFIVNHFVETGILAPYLSDACQTKDYRICEFKNDLGWNFIWNEEGPFRKTGGWEANRQEYNAIILDLVTTPKFWPIIFQKSIEYGFIQFFTFQTTVSEPQLTNSPPGRVVPHRFKLTTREYFSSLQNLGRLELQKVNGSEEWVILISMAILFLALIFPDSVKGVPPQLKYTILAVLLFSFIGSFVSANLSSIEPRYQNRIVWLFPVLVGLLVISIAQSNLDRKDLLDRVNL